MDVDGTVQPLTVSIMGLAEFCGMVEPDRRSESQAEILGGNRHQILSPSFKVQQIDPRTDRHRRRSGMT
ncbi:MAG: hypothetical protein EAZ61_00990 [Oscillatoriales cyanobacterium]|nr:MAG: hypothetical protein EAZ61_00990 [Oscillatoriales cyanobacterium]